MIMDSTSTVAVVQNINETSSEPAAVLTLRPTSPQTDPQRRKKVVWTEDTVDNEHMNKKKSKCCCIYEKPRKFGESSSEDSDDECEHCFGHVEKKKKNLERSEAGGTVAIQEATSTHALQAATLVLRPTSEQPPGRRPTSEQPPGRRPEVDRDEPDAA